MFGKEENRGDKCSESSEESQDKSRCSDSESSDHTARNSGSESSGDIESSDEENDHVFPCVLIGHPHGHQYYVSLGKSHKRDDVDVDYEYWWNDTVQCEFYISCCSWFSGGLI